MLALLDIPATATLTFDQMDESQGGESNAILIAASVLLEEGGYITSPSSPVAGLSELVATLSSALTGDAGLSPSIASLLSCQARESINASAAAANLQARLASLGLDAGVPDFAPLLDVPDGCEPLGAQCDSGVAAADGGPVAIASGLTSPDHLTIDSTYVYWTTGSNNEVLRVPKTGGCVLLLASSPNAWGIAVDQANLYFTTDNSGSVMSVPNAGGDASTIWSGQPGDYALGITTDPGEVYWVAVGSSNIGQILEAPKDGGGVSALASAQINPFAIAVDGTNAYWTWQGPNNPVTTNGMILSAPLSGAAPLDGGGDASGGGPVSVLANQQYLPMWIAVDSTNVYWTTWGDGQPGQGTVMQAPLAGPDAGAPITLATDNLPYALAVDTGFVYWVTYTDPGTVTKVPIGGGTPITLATGQHTPQSLAIDSANIYWTNTGTQAHAYGDGAIMKLAK